MSCITLGAKKLLRSTMRESRGGGGGEEFFSAYLLMREFLAASYLAYRRCDCGWISFQPPRKNISNYDGASRAGFPKMTRCVFLTQELRDTFLLHFDRIVAYLKKNYYIFVSKESPMLCVVCDKIDT
jgi:hypothetical protein